MTKAIIISQLKYTGQLEDSLLLRAVRRINRFIQPDVVIIFTDGQRQPADCLQEIIKKIKCPVVINTVGNEDVDHIDIGNCRFISALDESRIRQLSDCSARVILYRGDSCSLQDKFVKDCGCSLVISGRGRSGYKRMTQEYGELILAPDFNIKPFAFLELDIDSGESARITAHHLSVPAELELFDYHVHSHFAYCNENMNLQNAMRLAEMFNLKGLAFTEHNRHLYYDKSQLRLPVVERREVYRVDDYLSELAKYRSDKVLAGLELDFDFSGSPTMRRDDIAKFDIVLGSVHALPRLSFEDIAVCSSNFKGIWLNAVASPVNVMAHPLRVFWKGSSGGTRLSPDDYQWLAGLLKEHDIAAEMNFHSNSPDPDFFRICLENGVRISLGTDSHNLADIGDFYPHLEMLDKLTGLKDLDRILYKHPPK